MKQLTSSRLLALVCFVLAIGVLASCKKDNDDTNNGQVQLFSFGPAGVKYGDTLRFIGQNLDKVTAIKFTGANAEVKQSEFKQQSADLILVTVPATAEKGVITLKTPNGDIVTKTDLNLNVKTAVSVASVTKSARPGENITLSGNYLNWVRRVTFPKNKQVTTFVSQSMNQLVVKVPDDAQTGPLVVSFAGTDTLDVQTADTVKVALPTATSFAPNPVKHGTDLTITGTNLDLVKKVYFTGVTAAVTTFVSQNATQLVVKVPGTATKGKVTLEAASAVQTSAGGDLDIALPAVTAMTPSPVAIGSDLTLTGTNLDLVTGIAFTGVANAVTTFVSKSPTQLVVKVPTGTQIGKLTLSIANSTLTVKTANDLQIVGASVAPIIIYDNALNSGWQMWGGWNLTDKVLENTEHPKSGTNAIKIVYADAYGGFQLHPANNFPFPPAGYTKLKLSIYGGENATATSRVSIYMKDADNPTDAQTKIVTIVPGQYTTFEIPLTDFTNNPAKVNEFVIKNYGTANLTIYVDDISFE